jgi:hypothetical protein
VNPEVDDVMLYAICFFLQSSRGFDLEFLNGDLDVFSSRALRT